MFRINRKQSGTNWSIFQLEDETANIRAEIIPSAGAILNGWWVGGHNLIDGYTGQEDFVERVHAGFRSAKLLPFVCRLHMASYQWRGNNYRLDKFLLNGSALHGIIYDKPFSVISEEPGDTSCRLALQFQYPGDHPGYPFPFVCEVSYTLGEEGRLTIETVISSPADAASDLPVVDGWHPYFSLGGQVNGWRLQFASDAMMEYDDRLIPTGKYIHRDEFLEGRLIGDLNLDNGFLLRQDASPFCVLSNPATGLWLKFLRQENYPFLQLYIPDHRQSIAIENLSGAPDAFNNGIGLTVLTPGVSKTFLVEIQAGLRP